MMELGYPELAIGDLWKAHLLCKEARVTFSARILCSDGCFPEDFDSDDGLWYAGTGGVCVTRGDSALAQFALSWFTRTKSGPGGFSRSIVVEWL
jgi:hypothetical protein